MTRKIPNFLVKLNTPKDVKDFTKIASSCPYGTKIVIPRDKYTQINGSSILGLYSINLSEPFEVQILSNELDEVCDEVSKRFDKWKVTE